MPALKGPYQVGVLGDGAYAHIVQDGVAGVGPFSPNFAEMLLGRRSGGVNKANAYDASPVAALAGVYTPGGTMSAIAAGTLTDALQTWPVNLWNNFAVLAYTTATPQIALIASNTATVLTLKANWNATPTNATKYIILPTADQNFGATVTYAAGPANALVDTAKAWAVNQWRGYWVMAQGAASTPELRQIVSNTATQLTLDRAWGTNPAANSQYAILAPMQQGYDEWQRGAGSSVGINPQGPNLNPYNL